MSGRHRQTLARYSRGSIESPRKNLRQLFLNNAALELRLYFARIKSIRKIEDHPPSEEGIGAIARIGKEIRVQYRGAPVVELKRSMSRVPALQNIASQYPLEFMRGD